MRPWLTMMSVGICAITVGCADMGTDKFDTGFIRAHAVPGRTTEQDIMQIYGQPERRYLTTDGSGHSEALDYSNASNGGTGTSGGLMQMAAGFIPGAGSASSALSAANSQHRGKSVTFWFDTNGVLKNYNLSD